MRAWILPALALLLLACALPANAQQAIFRCVGAHGEPVFSGQPCGTPVPASSAAGAASTVGAGRFGGRCAATPEALRQAIARAFATHDVNQLAGLLVWRGVGQAAARARLQSLAGWLREPLSGITTIYANGPPPLIVRSTDANPGAAAAAALPSSGSTAGDEPGGFVVATGGGAGNTRDFGVVQSGGCWWLTF